MAIDKLLYIHSGRDGILGDTSETDVKALVAALRGKPKVAIHVHGGLVSKQAALDSAAKLAPEYLKAGIQPIFMVWESGFLEAVRNNLHEINREAIFQALVQRLLKYAVGKLNQSDGDKGVAGLALV